MYIVTCWLMTLGRNVAGIIKKYFQADECCEYQFDILTSLPFSTFKESWLRSDLGRVGLLPSSLKSIYEYSVGI